MEIVDLDIEMEDDLSSKTRDLAVRYFGDDSSASLTRVLEIALTMRCLWSSSITKGQQETDEVVSQWEFTEPKVNENYSDIIGDWLFRR